MGAGGGAAAGGVLAVEMCAPLLLLCWLCCWPDDASGNYGARKRRGGGAAAGGVLAVEMCAPLLLLCWLCCWPDDASDSSSSGHPRKPVLATESGRRSGGLRARLAGSALSLHLPGPSGDSPARSTTGSLAVPAHRSHEELTLYSASAPGVIREVLHRRDWDRSARDLYIPLHPDPETLSSPATPRAPRATPDSPPTDEEAPRCKKHHSNIKSSRGKEQRVVASERDEESPSRFYIGDDVDTDRVEQKPPPPEKEEKQCLNESIRSKERPWRLPAALGEPAPDDPADRSGAVHHALDSRAAMGSTRAATLSPISVDAVGYASLAGSDSCESLERPDRCAALPPAPPAAARARHASDGDILAPALRPQSGAFSESELELEMQLALQAHEEQQQRQQAEQQRQQAQEQRQQARAARGPRGDDRPARADVRETAI